MLVGVRFQGLQNRVGNFIFFPMQSDPIADFLTRIRNASQAKNEALMCPYSKIKEEMGTILEREGFIEKSRVDRSGKFPVLRISLSPTRGQLSLKRVSRPGRRVYKSAKEIRSVQNGFGISIISTSSGLKTDTEARMGKMGGEVLCEIF